jgi:hypothetical protein
MGIEMNATYNPYVIYSAKNAIIKHIQKIIAMIYNL